MISAILTLGVQLKALSLICGISFFTSILQKTCIVIFQDLSKYYSIFFSFKCKPNNFCQSNLAEIQTFGRVLCIFTHKEAECKLLKRILRVGILVQNLSRCKLIQPHWEWRSYENWYVLTFGLLILRGRFKVFKDSSVTFYTVTFSVCWIPPYKQFQ